MTLYIGVDFHPHQQTVSFCETQEGEVQQTSLAHNPELVRRFYEQFPKAVVGVEASCSAAWFKQMLFDLGHELKVGNPTLIRARARSRHKSDKRDADLILDLLVKDEFPALWRRPVESQSVLEQLRFRHQLVKQRTQVCNRLQALAHTAGDFHDPMVGRDILIGGVSAGFFLLAKYLSNFVKEFGFGEKRVIDIAQYSASFNSLPESMAELLNLCLRSISTGLAFLAVFLIIYFFVRNRKAALILICLPQIMTNKPIGEHHPVIYVGVVVGILIGNMFVFNRFGLVALISFLFFIKLHAFPMTFNPTSLIFPQTVLTLAILFGAMAYAAYISIGGAKMFGEKSFLGD